MPLPDLVQQILLDELIRLTHDPCFDLHPQRRIDIYRALGPSSVIDDSKRIETSQVLPHLSAADRVRTRLALLTAYKVAPLWQTACRETDTNFTEHEDPQEVLRQEQEYIAQLRRYPIEAIPVYDVPRSFIPRHILEMAELAFTGNIGNYDAFAYEAGEWWQMYGRPERIERECFIKWAAQDALYEALGWSRHLFTVVNSFDVQDDIAWASQHTDGPASEALLAYAAIFNEPQFRFDNKRRRAFWRWWLAEAIPQAWRLECL